MFKDLQHDLCTGYAPSNPTPWYSNPLTAWLLPFLDLALALGTLLLLARCLIEFLKQQATSIAKITTNQVLFQYQTTLRMDVDYDAPL